jgi:hypothetical protein
MGASGGDAGAGATGEADFGALARNAEDVGDGERIGA